jgi:hypothetical protein
MMLPTRDDLDALLDGDRVDTLRQVRGGVSYDGLGACMSPTPPPTRSVYQRRAPTPPAPAPREESAVQRLMRAPISLEDLARLLDLAYAYRASLHHRPLIVYADEMHASDYRG